MRTRTRTSLILVLRRCCRRRRLCSSCVRIDASTPVPVPLLPRPRLCWWLVLEASVLRDWRAVRVGYSHGLRSCRDPGVPAAAAAAPVAGAVWLARGPSACPPCGCHLSDSVCSKMTTWSKSSKVVQLCRCYAYDCASRQETKAPVAATPSASVPHQKRRLGPAHRQARA